MNKNYTPESAMAIVAHPDDIEFTCAGTLARWVKNQARISYVLCTSGDVGIDVPGMTREKAAQIREKEQLAAAEVVGATEVIFLREPDGLLLPTIGLRKRLVREIRRFRPEVVICGDPTIVWIGDDYINHPDHRAAATAAIDAVFPAAGQPNLFEDLIQEGLQAFKPRKVYIISWNSADHYVSIDETIDIKIRALALHKSQMREGVPEKMIRDWAAERGRGKEMTYAEAFKVITIIDDKIWQKQTQP